MIISWYTLYTILSVSLISFFFVVILSHIVSKLIFRRKNLKLNSESVIVITGGCMGIGKQMAIKLSKQYHPTIIIIDRRKDLFEDISMQIKKYNGICQCLYCDLSDIKSVNKVIQQLKEQRKKIDFFLYNAGVFMPNLCWETSDQQLNLVMNINFYMPVKMVRQLLPELEGGHIGIINSVTGIIDGSANSSSYVASKHAALAYFNTFRQQLILLNKPISISIACPWAINTTLFKGFKTKINFIFPVLDENYAAQRIIKQFISRKQICFIGRRHAFTQYLLNFFPSPIKDRFHTKVNNSNFEKKPLNSITDMKKKNGSLSQSK